MRGLCASHGNRARQREMTSRVAMGHSSDTCFRSVPSVHLDHHLWPSCPLMSTAHEAGSRNVVMKSISIRKAHTWRAVHNRHIWRRSDTGVEAKQTKKGGRWKDHGKTPHRREERKFSSSLLVRPLSLALSLLPRLHGHNRLDRSRLIRLRLCFPIYRNHRRRLRLLLRRLGDARRWRASK